MKKLAGLLFFLISTQQIFAFDVYPGEKDTLRQSVFSSPVFHDNVRGGCLNVPDFLECNLLNWLATQPAFSPVWTHKVEFEIIVDQHAPAVDTSFQIAIESGFGGVYLRKDTITVNINIINSEIVSLYSCDLQKGPVPLTVQFTNNSTGKYTNLLWDFGDGTTSASENPQHVYNTAGTFDVSLIAYSETEADTFLQENYIQTFNMPTVSVEGGGGICPGDSVQVAFKFTGAPPWKFKFTDGSLVFQDSTTFPKYSFFVKEAGMFHLTELRDIHDTLVTNFGAPVEVWLHPVPPKPEIAYEKSLTICQGESVLLSGSENAHSYWWTTLETTQTIEISQSKVVALKIANEFGCESALSDSFRIEVAPLPKKPTVHHVADTLTVSNEADSIQWYKNGAPLIDSTSTRLIFSESANYKVEIFNQYGCGIFSDEAYYIISDAFYLPETEDFFEVFPNPFTNKLQVIYSGKTSDLKSWSLVNSNGEIIKTHTFDFNGAGNFIIETTGMHSGIYFLLLESENLKTVKKLVKNND